MKVPLESALLLPALLTAKTTSAVEALLNGLPIVDETAYQWTAASPASAWQAGKLHWIPIGRDRGNAGRVQLAGDPYNPIAERLVNGMEAVIELARRLEMVNDGAAPMPLSPRQSSESMSERRTMSWPLGLRR